MGKLERLRISKGVDFPEKVSISLPSSKSISNRLLVMRALSGNAITIQNLSEADDTVFLDEFLATETPEKWVGEAGTALRFGLAWAAITPGQHIIKGSHRITQRPISGLVDALRSLGADIKYLENEGFAPLEVNGKKLSGGSVEIEGHLSSQFVTAILLIAPYLENGISIKLAGNQVSRPYIEMTLALMKQAGTQLNVQGDIIEVKSGNYKPTTFKVESDWSAASYFYAFKYLNLRMDIRIEGVSANSLQGDFGIVELAKEMGLESHFENDGVRFESIDKDFPAQLDFYKMPDVAQTFAVMAAGVGAPLELIGLQTLRVKETDRIEALVNELKKCGVACKATTDTLEIVGFADVNETLEIETYDDHRMAMAFAPLASVLGEIVICNPGVVSKSFPDFWTQVEKMGFTLSRT